MHVIYENIRQYTSKGFLVPPARFFRGFGMPARALAFGRAMFGFGGASWNSSGVRACRRADCDLGPPAADMVSRWCLAAAARHVSPATALFPALWKAGGAGRCAGIGGNSTPPDFAPCTEAGVHFWRHQGGGHVRNHYRHLSKKRGGDVVSVRVIRILSLLRKVFDLESMMKKIANRILRNLFKTSRLVGVGGLLQDNWGGL